MTAPGLPPFWELVGFGDRMDAWIALEGPDDVTKRRVAEWIVTRYDTPYSDVRRVPDFLNLWGGAVPNTERGLFVVYCSYWIFEDMRQVRCDSLATLRLPV